MELIKLLWRSEESLWIEQWPLKKEKLEATHSLVQEQLQKGHIESSTSPWNSPTLCHLYIDTALNPVCHSWPHLYISHYMDDILFAGLDIEELESLLKVLPTYFEPFGLVITPEKIQRDLVVN